MEQDEASPNTCTPCEMLALALDPWPVGPAPAPAYHSWRQRDRILATTTVLRDNEIWQEQFASSAGMSMGSKLRPSLTDKGFSHPLSRSNIESTCKRYSVPAATTSGRLSTSSDPGLQMSEVSLVPVTQRPNINNVFPGPANHCLTHAIPGEC